MTMKNTAIACVILAAGKGTRMKSSLPKVMHPLANRPMLGHVLHTADALNAQQVITIVGPGMPMVESLVEAQGPHHTIAHQTEQLGTGHAVLQAKQALEGFNGIVLVLYGDTPLIQQHTLELMAATMQESGAAVSVLGMRLENPHGYGRLITNERGELLQIVEEKEASDAQKAVNFCNSGVMAVRGEHLFAWLSRITNSNAKGEYYLTDLVEIARADGAKAIAVEAEPQELAGVNDRAQLAALDAVYQQRKREQLMASGVTLQLPESIYFSADTVIEPDVIIEPHVVFAPGVIVHSGAHIRAFSHLEGVTVHSGAAVGPYARLRPGTEIGKDAKVGNFVELKKATLEEGAKVSHLSYIGDARIGEHANIGAGTITCNYNGYEKFHTDIGAYSFVGSNTALVAPVVIGDGAIIGAGSVITDDVEKDSLAMTRPHQLLKPGWARDFHRKKQN